MSAGVMVGIGILLGAVLCGELQGSESLGLLDNNLRCVDLSDLTSSVPLETARSLQILWRTEAWEHNTFERDDGDTVGYPSVVKNDRGRNPDQRYYLFYAHHDPCSGIGCAIAETIEGPYRKLADADASRPHSLVLANPRFPIANPPVSDPSHYSSPCVIWNEDEKLWFMYFHYYNHHYESWSAAGRAGYGHQMTALATCPDLRSHCWTVLTDPKARPVSVWELVPVLPTTEKEWMNSQSSYHAIQRLPDGRWLAFLRGTSAGQRVQVGFAGSADGRSWRVSPESPVIGQAAGAGARRGPCRPYFVGYLGRGMSGKREYLLVWGESPAEADVPRVMYGYTSDFVTLRRDPRGFAKWRLAADGMVSPWREKNRLYLFSGKHLQVMELPVPSRASGQGAAL
jgi:hypothetical protein